MPIPPRETPRHHWQTGRGQIRADAVVRADEEFRGAWDAVAWILDTWPPPATSADVWVRGARQVVCERIGATATDAAGMSAIALLDFVLLAIGVAPADLKR